MTFPSDHQGLFDFAVENGLRLIGEFSISIREDARRWLDSAREYARNHELLDQVIREREVYYREDSE